MSIEEIGAPNNGHKTAPNGYDIVSVYLELGVRLKSVHAYISININKQLPPNSPSNFVSAISFNRFLVRQSLTRSWDYY